MKPGGGGGVIDTLLNLLFRCPHRHLTRPLTRVGKPGRPGDSYVVCLDCGKQFAYDLDNMRIGKPIDHSHDASVSGSGVTDISSDPKIT